MPKLIPNKRLIVDAYHNRHVYGITIQHIALIFKVDPKTINNYIHQPDEFIDSSTIVRKSFMHNLSDDVINFVINNAVNNPHFSVKKVTRQVNKLYKTNLSNRQIYAILHHNNITYKKGFDKRKPAKPADVVNAMITDRINQVGSADDVIFSDEVHIELADTNKYGWNKKGEKVVFDKCGPSKVLNKRITVIASVSKNKKIGYKIYEKSVTGETFRSYVRWLNKKTQCKNHYVDNARIHHYKGVKKTSKRLKLNMIYGVAYTPYLNIIANFFRSFKANLRKELIENRTNIKKTIRKCWNNVKESVISNTYNHVYVKKKQG